MEKFLDISKYTIYNLRTDKNIRVAVPVAYSERIRQLIQEHGSLEKVPSSITVRGVFLKKDPEIKEIEMLKANDEENDVTVNQLMELC